MLDNQELAEFDCVRNCRCDGDLSKCPNISALAETYVQFRGRSEKVGSMVAEGLLDLDPGETKVLTELIEAFGPVELIPPEDEQPLDIESPEPDN